MGISQLRTSQAKHSLKLEIRGSAILLSDYIYTATAAKPAMVMSVQKLSAIIVIVLMQVCLLNAKGLRIARQSSSTIINGNPGVGVNDQRVVSCSPDQSEMEYYNALYSTNAANSFSGNAMHHALRAMEADKNRANSTTTTAADNAIIANITDQSRFTPAGMDAANKVVCARILQQMDVAASVIIQTALCGWDYVCDYKPDRFPKYLFKARCKTPRCKSNCSQENNHHNRCQSHAITVTVLQMIGNCEEWVWGQELLPIACTCTPDAMIKSEA